MKKVKTRRSIVISVMTIIVVTLTVSAATIYASDDNIGYKFRIGTYYDNSQEPDGRYRQTLKKENPWKVNLKSSEEGKGTITTFWLEDRFFINVSYERNAKQGAGAYYTEALNEASDKMVYLTAQNNNWSSVAYVVEGIWDEETW